MRYRYRGHGIYGSKDASKYYEIQPGPDWVLEHVETAFDPINTFAPVYPMLNCMPTIYFKFPALLQNYISPSDLKLDFVNL